MTERTAAVNLKVRLADWTSGFGQAGRTVSNFSKQISDFGTKHKQALDKVAVGAGVAGASLLGLAGVAVKTFADFDQSMSHVQAATHETAANMHLLRNAAIDAGAKTVYSASEAAGGIEALAKAGVSTRDILKGGLAGALDLAASGNLNVADSAEIAATAMTQFKLAGSDVPHIADLLAAAAGKAQGEVSDMAFALRQSGLVASQFGLSVEDTTGTLAAFASAGLIGSDAGTSFKTMLLQLANPSAAAASTMKELGITAYDASGNFVGITNLAGQLHDRLQVLPQATRDQALAQIFGNDAIRAANVLYDQGAEGLAKWIKRVNDSGYAAETAALRLDNLRGDIEKLGGSLQTAFIGSAEGGNGPLRSLTQEATHLVEAFNNLPDPIKQATLLLVGGSGLALLGVAGMAKLVTSTAEAVKVMKELQLTTGRTAALMRGGAFVAGLAAAAAGIDYLAHKVNGLHGPNTQLIRDIQQFAKTGKTTGDLAKIVGDDFDKLGLRAQRVFDPSFKQKVDDFVVAPLHAIGIGSSQVDVARESFVRLDNTLAGMSQEKASKLFGEIKDRLLDAGYSVKQINSLFPEYRQKVADAAKANHDLSDVMGNTVSAADDQAGAVSDAAQALQDMDDRATDLKNSLDILNGTMSDLEAQSAYEGAIDDVTDRFKDYRKEVKKGDDATKGMKGAFDLSTKAGRDNFAAISDLWEKTGEYAEQVLRTSGDQSKANAVLAAGREQLVTVIAGFLGSKSAAEKYVEQVLHIPKNVSTKYSTPGLTDAERKARLLKETADYLNGKKVSTQFIEEHIDYRRTVYGESSPGHPNFRKGSGGATGGLYNPHTGFSRWDIGGKVMGPGSGTSDSVPAPFLSAGEFVSTAASAARNLDALMAGNRGARLYADTMVRGSAGMSSSAAGSATDGGGRFEGNLYLDSGQLLGIVRGEIRESNRAIRRRVTAGAGGAA